MGKRGKYGWQLSWVLSALPHKPSFTRMNNFLSRVKTAIVEMCSSVQALVVAVEVCQLHWHFFSEFRSTIYRPTFDFLKDDCTVEATKVSRTIKLPFVFCKLSLPQFFFEKKRLQFSNK